MTSLTTTTGTTSYSPGIPEATPSFEYEFVSRGTTGSTAHSAGVPEATPSFEFEFVSRGTTGSTAHSAGVPEATGSLPYPAEVTEPPVGTPRSSPGNCKQ